MSQLNRRTLLKSAPFPLGIPAAALAGLVLSGCMGYTLTPEKPAAMPRAQADPLPLTAGVVLESDGGFGARFAEALDGARLFKEVRRGATTGVDLVLRGRYKAEFVQDPLQAPKILLCVFTGLVTGAIMSETSHHLADGAVMASFPNGDGVKSYDERVDVTAKSMVSMFAEQKTMKLGPPAAMDNLVAKLVQRLIDDRDFLAGLKAPPRRPAPPPPAAAPVAEPVAEPVAVEAPAAVEPAPVEPAIEPAAVAESAPEPAPRRPLTSAEESEIDEQLMP